MNILYINNSYIPAAMANQATGIGRVTGQISDFCAKQYKDNIYLCFFSGSLEETAPHIVHQIKLTEPLSKSAKFKDAQILGEFLDKYKIDVIQVNIFGDVLVYALSEICKIAHQHNIKVIYCIHFIPGFESLSYGSWTNVWYNITHHKPLIDKIKKSIITTSKPLSTKIIRRLIRHKYEDPYICCDKIVVFSEPYIDEYLNISGETCRSKFAVIPNPLSFNEFLSKEQLKSKKKEVIMVGRLQESQKRVSLSLKIWKIIEQNPALDEWSFTLIGYGQDEDYLHWLAKRYQLKRVHFEGHQDPKPYYKRASIFISTAGFEGWPMVLMEAMPMGCCCLSFDSYDAVYDIIVDGYNGKIIPNNNIKEYANCLTELMINDEKRITMGNNAIESSHQFSMDTIGKLWHDLFEEQAKCQLRNG